MANRPAPFTQADVKRAVKGTLEAGMTPREIIASADGVRVLVDADNPEKPTKSDWDEVLE